MKLGMVVGRGCGLIMLDGDSSPPNKGTQPPQFSAHMYCHQMAECIRVPFGTDVCLGTRDIVLDGDPCKLLPKRGTHPNFWPMSVVAMQTAG